ncbi:zinc ABC transporter substrate-binding protein [Puteibacter caeruleilacunae]|nr:zinc ABC transporter substrate-binding protein [Puteibacter caeruleilacunae]
MNKVVLGLLVMILAISCSTKKDSEKPVVVVSIIPQKYVVEKIAGDYFNVQVMVKPGASPATYAPTPRQMKDVGNALGYLKIGYIGFEVNWMKKLQSSNTEMRMFDLSYGIKIIAGETVQHGDHVHYHGIDPHLWMSPKNMLVIAANAYEALVKLAPEQAAVFEKNYANLKDEIEVIKRIADAELNEVNKKEFMIFHPALTYLARDYQLTQIALEDDGKEPSANHMKHVIDEANEHGINVIFIQKEFNAEQAQSVAQEINGKVVQIDPLAYEWTTQMKDIINKLGTALK